MDEDSRFRWVPPVCFITIWIILLTGPFLFPRLFCIFISFMCYCSLLRGIYILICESYALVKTIRLPTYQKQQYKTEYIYTWVIPTVNEDEQILLATLKQLAKPSRSKDFVVFLAFENVDKGVKDKAEIIIKKFRNSFRHIDYTIHKLQPGQVRGKASNISWCVQQFKYVMPKDIDLDKIILTIIDSDSRAPVEYIDHINAHLYKNPDKAYKTVFIPTMLFKNNDLEVPVLTRAFDHYHCMGHYMTTVTIFDMCLPLSNYTMSYRVLERSGFWDKGEISIAEDAHNFGKLFWKNNGDIYGVPIYTPFIQSNIQSGDNYLANVRAKYTQCIRHAMGIFESSYNLQKFVQCKTKTTRSYLFIFFILQAILFHATFTSFTLIYIIVVPHLLPASTLATLPVYFKQVLLQSQTHLNIITAMNLCGFLLFDAYKRYSFRRWHNGKNEQLWRLGEYLLFSVVGLASILVPSLVIAAFSGKGGFTVTVADKFVKGRGREEGMEKAKPGDDQAPQ